ncbi:MAG: CRISPR-associated ring nuclease Csm6 [Methylovulum sp.]|jgi:CRISPR-associated protein (TIGR02584 family)
MTHYTTHILLAVTGLSPQVVTETVFALHQQGQKLPDEIHLLSTSEGAERARLTLFTDQWFEKLCNDYTLPPIRFTADQIHILEDAEGRVLDDIRNLSDNHAAADCISEWIRRMTTDEHTSLHVSIAGGRKTMGFYAGYALSLYGRQQDRLSHVLVSSPYEAHPQFYYPTPTSHIIYAIGQASKPLDTKDAKVTLAEIPFVRLRHGLPEAVRMGKSSFTMAVNSAQERIGTPHVQIDLHQCIIYCAGKTLSLAPAELAFYSWMARRILQGMEALKCPSAGAPEIAYTVDYLLEYQLIKQPEAAKCRTEKTLAQGMENRFFEQRKARVNAKIKKTLGIYADPYLIQAQGGRLASRYGLGLSAEHIDYE